MPICAKTYRSPWRVIRPETTCQELECDGVEYAASPVDVVVFLIALQCNAFRRVPGCLGELVDPGEPRSLMTPDTGNGSEQLRSRPRCWCDHIRHAPVAINLAADGVTIPPVHSLAAPTLLRSQALALVY